MNWYLQSNENSDVVRSTRIRLVRNINGLKFNLNAKEKEILKEKIKENLYSIGYDLKFLELKDMDVITKNSLVEKNIISQKYLAEESQTGSILINDLENICIMLGGENHLSIQVFESGLNLENTLNLAIEIEEKIGEILDYSISKKYGYLTKSLNDIGTGLKASVMLELPALAKTGNLKKILNTIRDFNINIDGEYGKTSKNLDYIYQISNKQTIGITEKEIVNNINVIAKSLIEQERQARRILLKEGLELEDTIHRSYGILTNCKKISYSEAKELLTNIKIGVDTGILDKINDFQVKRLFLYIKPANLQKYYGEEMDKIEQDIKRAELIKQIAQK